MERPLARLRARLAGVRLFASAGARRRVVVHLALAAAGLAAAGWLLAPQLAVLADPAALRVLVRGYGAWGPVVVVCLQAAQVVVAPVPGQVLGVVSGYLFGVWWGTLYNVLGVTAGSAAAFALSRRVGRPYVERVIDPELLARFDAVDDEHVRTTLLVLFLVPGLPDDLLCFAGGLTRLPLWQLVALAAVGRTPGFLLATLAGDLLGTGRPGPALALLAALVAAGAVGYHLRDRLWARLGGR